MKTALVGLGRMGLRHLEVIKSLGLEVVGGADVGDAALAKAAEAGIARERLFKDPLAMLRDVKAECVVIATTAPRPHARIPGRRTRLCGGCKRRACHYV